MTTHKEYFTHHGQKRQLLYALKDNLDGFIYLYIMGCMTNQTADLNNIIRWF